MKKIIFLLVFLWLALPVLALDPIPAKQYLVVKNKSFFGEKLRPKSFAGGNCELNINWRSPGFNYQLIYTQNFPPALAKYLNNNTSGKIFSAFSITFLDDNDFELVKGTCYFDSFIINEKNGQPRAVISDYLNCDADIYNRISAVIIDFSQ